MQSDLSRTYRPIEVKNEPSDTHTIGVVISTCYGGFGLSEAAKSYLKEHTPEIDSDLYDESENRSHPELVKVVKLLGDAANGPGAELVVKYIETEFNGYFVVHEYDGWESLKIYPERLIQNEIIDLSEEDIMLAPETLQKKLLRWQGISNRASLKSSSYIKSNFPHRPKPYEIKDELCSSHPVGVVINSCYGGFGLSSEAKRHLKEHAPELDLDSLIVQKSRSNCELVKIVNKLGADANGQFAKLTVKYIEREFDGYFVVHEYDGWESLQIYPERLVVEEIRNLTEDEITLAAEELRRKLIRWQDIANRMKA